MRSRALTAMRPSGAKHSCAASAACTCEPGTQTRKAAPAPQTSPVVKARSGVADGVKLGCGMFIVLPLLLLGLGVLLLIFLAATGSSK